MGYLALMRLSSDGLGFSSNGLGFSSDRPGFNSDGLGFSSAGLGFSSDVLAFIVKDGGSSKVGGDVYQPNEKV